MSGINQNGKVNSSNSTAGVSKTTSTEKKQTTQKKENIPFEEQWKRNKVAEANKNIDEKLKSGEIEYREAGFVSKILGGEDMCKIYFDKAITLGDAKSMFNLADGTLKHNWDGTGGGNLDLYKCPKDKEGNYYVTVGAKDLAAGAEMSVDDMKAKFPKNAIHK